jgi:hypothetical protein
MLRCTGLRLLACEVYLHKHRQSFAALLFAHALEAASELERVDGVDNVEELYRSTGFIRLKMAYQVPFGSIAAELANLVLSLLDPVLAEDGGASGDRLTQRYHRVRFAYGDELDLGRIAANASSRSGYPIQNRLVAIAHVWHGLMIARAGRTHSASLVIPQAN